MNENNIHQSPIDYHVSVERIYTAEEIADYLNISLSQLYRFFKHKENPLAHYQLGYKTFRVKGSDLLKWLERSRKENLMKKNASLLNSELN